MTEPTPEEQPAPSPGRKFLRRGQGISRYGKVSNARLPKKRPIITAPRPQVQGEKNIHRSQDGAKTASKDVKPVDRGQAKKERSQVDILICTIMR